MILHNWLIAVLFIALFLFIAKLHRAAEKFCHVMLYLANPTYVLLIYIISSLNFSQLIGNYYDVCMIVLKSNKAHKVKLYSYWVTYLFIYSHFFNIFRSLIDIRFSRMIFLEMVFIWITVIYYTSISNS